MKQCQSCGMPMENPELYGTNADGSKNDEYCIYCFKDGQFGSPNETMEEMIVSCIPFMVEEGYKEADARKMMEELLPTLNRWK